MKSLCEMLVDREMSGRVACMWLRGSAAGSMSNKVDSCASSLAHESLLHQSGLLWHCVPQSSSQQICLALTLIFKIPPCFRAHLLYGTRSFLILTYPNPLTSNPNLIIVSNSPPRERLRRAPTPSLWELRGLRGPSFGWGS